MKWSGKTGDRPLASRGPVGAVIAAALTAWLSVPSVLGQSPHHWRFDPIAMEGGSLMPIDGTIALPLGDDVKWDPAKTTPSPGESAPGGWVLDGKVNCKLPTNAGVNLRPDDSFTLAAWVRVDAFPAWSGIVGAIRDNGDDESGWMLGLRGRQPFIAVASSSDVADDPVKLEFLTTRRFAIAHRWTFLAATRSGRQLKLYVDGKVAAETTLPGDAIVYADGIDLHVGAFVDSNENYPLTGRLGELWLRGDAIDDAAVAALHASTKPTYPDRPQLAADPLGDTRFEQTVAGQVGESTAMLLPTSQRIEPAGRTWAYGGRPVDLALSPDQSTLAVKDNSAVVLLDAPTWQPIARLPYPAGGASMHGILFHPDGDRLWVSTAQASVFEATRLPFGWHWTGEFDIPGPTNLEPDDADGDDADGDDADGDDAGNTASHPCGIAFDPRRNVLFVAASRNNAVAELDVDTGEVLRWMPVGVAPYDLLFLPADPRNSRRSTDQLMVSNWGGRHPDSPDDDDQKQKEDQEQNEDEENQTLNSSGTPVLVDDRGIARSGTVGWIDLVAGRQVAQVATGLHPADLAWDAAANQVIVANANSDTISVIDAGSFSVVSQTLVRPDENLPFGSATNALAISPDGQILLAANAGNNAIAVLRRSEATGVWDVAGFIPTAWYPGGLVVTDDAIFIANVKGFGSRPIGQSQKFNTRQPLGAVSKVPWPSVDELAEMSATVRRLGRVPQMLRHLERRESAGVAPVPIPAQLGDPSVIRHVVYIIKENRTYDQVFGDLTQGDGDPSLCDYPRAITPNHHALAEQFVLLDNFYCNGVLSADGHSWATEGNATDHIEKSFGGFTRSYTFGDDPLTYSSSGFLWDNALLHGLSFRNFGELDYAEPVPKDATFQQIYDDFVSGKKQIRFTQNIGIPTLARYSCPNYPGWNMRIPDVLRASVFIDELRQAEIDGNWFDLSIVFLPQDHTSGLTPGRPTPAAHVADNDLALGRVVEAISKSRFWKDTCIFVIEDDPQAGYDHVDGHRSVALVIGPHVRRGAVVSEFYNQTSVLHTMERILGLPPMNQFDAMSPLMTACFADQIDTTAYEALPPGVPLDQLVGQPENAPPTMRRWFAATAEQNLEMLDKADEHTMNQILWHAAHGPAAPYPAAVAGAHGAGLAARGLIRGEFDDDDDDDD